MAQPCSAWTAAIHASFNRHHGKWVCPASLVAELLRGDDLVAQFQFEFDILFGESPAPGGIAMDRMIELAFRRMGAKELAQKCAVQIYLNADPEDWDWLGKEAADLIAPDIRPIFAAQIAEIFENQHKVRDQLWRERRMGG